MITLKEKIKWNLHCIKRYYLTCYGLNKGLIKAYTEDQEIMDRFRNTYYGGVPLSIMLLCLSWTCGKCYDKALILASAFHDCEDVCMVDADIQGISLNLANLEDFKKQLGYLPEHYGNHCFVEVRDKSGITWVYDTTNGYVIEKNLYYEIEKPIITKINDKNSILNNPEYQDMLEQNLEHDKYALSIIMPNIEAMLQRAKENNELYSEELEHEINIFKEKINYNGICEEIKKDMKAKGFFELIRRKVNVWN